MHVDNVVVLSAPDNDDANGIQIDSNQYTSASFNILFADGSANGTIKIQASNDIFNAGYMSSAFTVSNWTDIPDASVTISAGGRYLLMLPNLCYRWMRVVYISSSGGSSTVTVNMFAQYP